MAPAIRYATQAPEHDPVPCCRSGAVTTHIGLGATFSISHQQPFYAARLWATLDYLMRGRAAWNVVTSLNRNQAANHGEERKPTDERYDHAHEFMEVCRKLWDSWEPEAVVLDREAFMLSPIYTPGAIEEFVDLVVPELQRRGRYRLDYAGTTQRNHLMPER